MNKTKGVTGDMCGGFWMRYRCGHRESLFAICECRYPNFRCQPNFAVDRHRIPNVLVERPYNCIKCTTREVEALWVKRWAPGLGPFYKEDPKGCRMHYGGDGDMFKVIGKGTAVFKKHGGGEGLLGLSAGPPKTMGGDSEKPGLGTSTGAQHQPSGKRQRSLDSEALPQRKSPRRRSGSVNLRTEARRQSSSSHCKFSGNAPSGKKVAMGASCPISGKDRLPSQRCASGYKALPPASTQRLTHRPGANSVPHASVERKIPSHRPGARNEEQPPKAQGPSRHCHSRGAPNNAARLSTVHEESHNEGSPQPKENYWVLKGVPDSLRPPHIPRRKYAAVRPDNPLLSSPKPPLRDPRQS